MFQPLTDHLIGAEQVRCRDTLTVGRVGYHDTLLLRLCEVLEVTLLHSDVAGQTGSTHIQACRIHSLDIHVIAVDMMVKLPFL